MTLKSLIAGLVGLFILVSCSSDDDGVGPANPNETATNYFPMQVGNQWTYQNKLDLEGEAPQEGTEKLTVDDSFTSNGSTSYTFTSNVSPAQQGVASMLFTNGQLTKVEGRLIYNGQFEYNISAIDASISIPLHNLIMYDQNIDSGQNLTSITDTVTKNINLSGTDVPVNFYYTFESYEDSFYESLSANNQEYDDVISSQFIVNLSASADILPGLSIDILLDQQVLQSTNYFAKGVGLIKSKNDINLEFEDLSEFGFPSLPPIHGDSSQILIDYSVD